MAVACLFSGTTKAAVSDGSIVIRDQQAQQQEVSELSRDTEHASGSISPIFNKEKEQRLAQAQLIAEVGNQVADIARTQGEINGPKAESAPAKLAEAREQLAAKGKPFSESDVLKQAHAVLGAVTSYASGNSALAGAAGGVSGELMMKGLYPGKTVSELVEEQKQTLSTLGTLAAAQRMRMRWQVGRRGKIPRNRMR